ncbi:hypothetical protein CPB84DRAFT_133662 [Gymnopilus junonius]|uniref:Uncharacterized protein n=1 Tax=Gymnopilus junonius TaxID=109634 RepID=A0A9P5NED0_GYMJU|nr:hypothetical protein CPB84DRAFT_133662 [Gymnopilus junonius]
MPQSPLSGVVRLVVSTDGEQYRVVDVSGAPDGNWIRRRILTKLSIPEQLHTQFSIYPSEAGALALGGALSDRRLFSHCRESGDPSGSLKFFVSTSPDRRVPADPGLAEFIKIRNDRQPITTTHYVDLQLLNLKILLYIVYHHATTSLSINDALIPNS